MDLNRLSFIEEQLPKHIQCSEMRTVSSLED